MERDLIQCIVHEQNNHSEKCKYSDDIKYVVFLNATGKPATIIFQYNHQNELRISKMLLKTTRIILA